IVLPNDRRRAMGLGVNSNSSIAANTLCRVASRTAGFRLSTRDTVPTPTPAFLATSLMVTLAISLPLLVAYIVFGMRIFAKCFDSSLPRESYGTMEPVPYRRHYTIKPNGCQGFWAEYLKNGTSPLLDGQLSPFRTQRQFGYFENTQAKIASAFLPLLPTQSWECLFQFSNLSGSRKGTRIGEGPFAKVHGAVVGVAIVGEALQTVVAGGHQGT